GQELDDVYNNSDLGLGAFGYRRNETTGSCLKTKEYFAKGLPFINGWKEPAFDDTYPYVLRFDTKEEYIDFEEVIKFYENIKMNKNIQMEMRDFAKNNYTWEKQFEAVFDALN